MVSKPTCPSCGEDRMVEQVSATDCWYCSVCATTYRVVTSTSGAAWTGPTAMVLAMTCLLLAAPTIAQTPVAGTERLAWSYDGPAVDRFEARIDGGAALTLVTQRSGTHYNAPLPALTPGVHTIAVVACNVAGCGPESAITITVVVLPTAVTTLRIERGGA